MNNSYLLCGIFVMALVTYLIRVIPMVVFRRKIESRFIRSFLFYVPYSVLSAMTFPGIFFCTGNIYSAAAGTLSALFLASKKKSLVVVALGAAAITLAVQILTSSMI